MLYSVFCIIYASVLIVPCFAGEHKFTSNKYLDFNYFGSFEGPSVFNPDKYLPDRNGDYNFNRPIILTNYITTAYNLNPDLSLGVLTTFEVFPFEDSVANGLDPAIKLTHRGLFKNDNFNTLFDLKIFLPVTEASKKSETITVMQSLQMIEYMFAKSRFSLGSTSTIEVGFFGDKDEDVKDFSFSLAPSVNYYLTEETSLSFIAGASLNHYKNSQSITTLIEDDYIGPGVNFSFGDTFSISPALTSPLRNPMLKNMSILAIIYFKLE